MRPSVSVPTPEPPRPWIELFDDRYGAGTYARLLDLFDDPCTSFADIAASYGVTRERVRQWHLQLRPDAPRGHQRRRLCLRRRQRRTLLSDPVFRTFYRHARAHFAPQQFALIPARTGYRRRSLWLGGAAVAIRTARPAATASDGVIAYSLSPRGRVTGFVYYQLTAETWLFLPAHLVPAAGTTFVDGPHSKYWPYRNTFVAPPPW